MILSDLKLNFLCRSQRLLDLISSSSPFLPPSPISCIFVSLLTYYTHSPHHSPKMTDVFQVTPEELVSLEAALLNTSGTVPLHNRFRALFTLKALKDDRAVEIITKGAHCLLLHLCNCSTLNKSRYVGFADESALLKHELAYCLGQIKRISALPILESVLTNENEDPMVRHEVSLRSCPCIYPSPLNVGS